MPFVKGQSGNPYGRITAREAERDLRMAVNTVITKGRHKGKTKLKRISEVITQCAVDGEPWACQMVHERLDGKAVQVIDQHMTVNPGEVFVDLLRALNQRRTTKVIEHAEVSEKAG